VEIKMFKPYPNEGDEANVTALFCMLPQAYLSLSLPVAKVEKGSMIQRNVSAF